LGYSFNPAELEKSRMTDLDIEPAPEPTDDDLRRVAALARRQLQLQAEVADAEAAYRAKVELLRANVEIDLPAAMVQVGLAEFALADGGRVKLSTDLMASIPSGERVKDPVKKAELLARRAAWFAWLRANNHDAIIKREVQLQLGKGDDNVAAELVASFREQFPGRRITDRENVAPQTLLALVREQARQGIEFPTELGVATVRRAVVELPKEDKDL
jgi:hypothetical protein